MHTIITKNVIFLITYQESIELSDIIFLNTFLCKISKLMQAFILKYKSSLIEKSPKILWTKH